MIDYTYAAMRAARENEFYDWNSCGPVYIDASVYCSRRAGEIVGLGGNNTEYTEGNKVWQGREAVVEILNSRGRVDASYTALCVPGGEVRGN